jgi:hypothetical protein
VDPDRLDPTRSEGKRASPSFIFTGERIEHGVQRLPEIYRLARELCADLFVAEETRSFDALYDYVPIGFVDELRKEIARKLELPAEIFSLDRFSIHGCGPVGLHDDSFRYPQYYFVMVIAHSGRLGLVDGESRAARHQAGDIVLLDPRRKHGLVREGACADDHIYESTHSPVYDQENQFLFLDLDVRRSDLRARFRNATSYSSSRQSW